MSHMRICWEWDRRKRESVELGGGGDDAKENGGALVRDEWSVSRDRIINHSHTCLSWVPSKA